MVGTGSFELLNTLANFYSRVSAALRRDALGVLAIGRSRHGRQSRINGWFTQEKVMVGTARFELLRTLAAFIRASPLCFAAMPWGARGRLQ